MRRSTPVFFCLLLSGFPLLAQTKVAPVIRLDGEAHDAVRGLSGSPPALSPPGTVPGRPSLYLVWFGGPTRAGWLEALRASGLDVLQYLPRFSYFVYGPPEALTAAKLRAPIFQSALFPAALKIAPHLESVLREPSSAGKPLDLILQLFDVGDSGTFKEFLGRAGGKVLWQTKLGRRIHLRAAVSARCLPDIARWSSLFRIERFPSFELRGEREAVICMGEHPPESSCVTPGYAEWLERNSAGGAGMIVHVMDDGIEQGVSSGLPGTAHPDILGQIAGLDNATSDPDADSRAGHGSINAGIIAAHAATGNRDDAGFLVGQGIAPEALVFGTKIFNNAGRFDVTSRSFTDLMAAASTAGSIVSSNSWGANTFGEYDATAAEFDALVRDAHPDPEEQPMTIVFAAGNEGDLTEGGAMSIGTPASAKNVISVGASESCDAIGLDGCDVPPEGADSLGDVVQFSSRGPLADGRLGPTLVAPGTHVAGIASTARGYDGSGVCDPYWPEGQVLYARSSGTSHACPHVAGAAALFQEAYSARAGKPASPALVKAALIASAHDMAGGQDGFGGAMAPVPSNVQGWGRLSLKDLLPREEGAPEALFFDQDTILDDTGDSWETLALPLDPARPIRVALVWTDAPGLPGSSPVLVNDLDLEVESAGELYHGNVFQDGISVPGGGPATLDNVECVYLASPGPVVKIRVVAANVAGDGVPSGDDTDQDFALIVHGGTDRSSRGIVSLRKSAYACISVAEVSLSDLDLRGAGTAQVSLESTAAAQPFPLTLNEVGEASGFFEGTVQFGAEEGQLLVADQGTVTARYIDADDGSGTPSESTAAARIDCSPPEISEIAVTKLTESEALIVWKTAEDATGKVHYGKSCGDTPLEARTRRRAMSHEVLLTGLDAGSRYVYTISAADIVGNVSRADAGGNCFSFFTSALSCHFEDDLEPEPVEGWTHQARLGPDDWAVRSFTDARSPPHAWSAHGFDGLKDASLISPPLNIEGGDRLTFWHAYQFEEEYDGAVLEISTDDGATWSDLGDCITRGGYTRQLDSTNPLGARPAWTGGMWDAGMSQVEVELSTWAGEGRRICFRIGCDSSTVAGFGWTIDDLSVCRLANKRGEVRLDRSVYGCGAEAEVRLEDLDLVGAGNATVNVRSSSSGPDPLEITLTESPSVRGIFKGTFLLGQGGLPALDGDDVRVEYLDADDGLGAGPSVRSAVARLDCVPPVISSIHILEMLNDEVTFAWETDEPALGEVEAGSACDSLELKRRLPMGGTTHIITVDGLTPGVYHYRISATDEAGNTTVEDAGGVCRIFSPTSLESLAFDFEHGAEGWTHGAAEGWDLWSIVETPQARSKPSAWFLPGSEIFSDVSLVSPPFHIDSGSVLCFWHTFQFEEDYDGAVLEISTDWGETWIDLGPSMLRGGYNSVLIEPNPIAGRRAWSGGEIGKMTRVIVDLEPWAGKHASVRFRATSDGSVGGGGWYIDQFEVCQPVREKATVILDRVAYGCEASVHVKVLDAGRIGLGSATVEISSPGEPAPEILDLAEKTRGSGVYEGSMILATDDAPGVLVARHGEEINVAYQDDEDGTGSPARPVATARVDCLAPIISEVSVQEIDETSATIKWQTDETTVGRVDHGSTCESPESSAAATRPGTEHEVRVTDLPPGTAYRFKIIATDEAGNATVDDQSGKCHGFRTRVLFCSFLDDLEPQPEPGWLGGERWRFVQSQFAHSPSHAWRIAESNARAEDTLTTPPVRALPGGFLEFWHTFGLPEGLSGGVLEASADGGVTWNDVEPDIVEGGYTGFLLPGSPLEGRRAWTGESTGPPRRVRVRLDALAGEIVFFRFRWASQGFGGDAGAWIIDDFKVCQLAGETGKVAFGELAYRCEAQGRVLLADANLVGAGTTTVEVRGPSQAAPLDVTATEESPGFFSGHFAIQGEDMEGFVKAAHGDILTATYRDVAGEDGAPGVAEDTAAVDCVPPRIQGMRLGDISFSGLQILWETNERAGRRAIHGSQCASLTRSAEMPGLGTSHTVRLAGIQAGSPVFFRVFSTDLAGNESSFPSSTECLDLSLAADCVLNDSFDPSSAVWAHAARVGSDGWTIVSFARSHSPTSSYHSPNSGDERDAFLVSPALDIPASSVLSFWHTYELEDGYDGARVEISTDGGDTWADLGPSILDGGYTGFVAPPGDEGPLPAWTGGRLDDMTLVSASLADHAGSGRRIRFRIFCDDSVGTAGWYIDDVSICTLRADTETARFTRGNCNADNVVNISDAIFLFNHLFKGGMEPACRRACDCDANDAVNLTDGIYILLYLFQGGLPIPPPNDCSATLGPSAVDCKADSCIAGL